MAINISSDCPYRGLQPYTEADREYFFGRERDRETIAANLFAAPLTILYGSSGVGKSSVLQAGAIPQLRENPRLIVALFGRWQGDTFDLALKSEVLGAVCKNTGKSETQVLQEVNQVLETKTPLTLEELSFDDLLTGCVKGFGRRILVIFDQFEEYFLYHAPMMGTEGFDAEFARAVNQQESGVNFMLAMREEELSKLDRFRPRIPTLLSNLLRLDHLDPEAATNAIRKPLDVYNEKHPQSKMIIEDALVREVISEVNPRQFPESNTGQLPSGSQLRSTLHDSKIETPFLQMVMVRLWEEEKSRGSSILRLTTFQELGGAKEIARAHLDKVMAQLSASERDIAASVLRFLVTPKGSKIALDPPTLAGFANQKEQEVRDVLTLLSSGRDMRILRKVTVPGQPGRYELFHDVLGPAILEWRARYLQTQQLTQQRAEAERKLERERRKSKRLRLVLAGIGLLLLLMTGVTVFAIQQYAEAKKQQKNAALSLETAQRAQAALEGEKKNVEIERDNAKTSERVARNAEQSAIAAQHLAEAEKLRADEQTKSAEQAKTQAVRSAKTDEWIRLALDESRAGNIDTAITNFHNARKLYKESKDPVGEAAALLNIAESNATKGAVLSLETLKLIGGLDDAPEESTHSESFTSYLVQLQYIQAIKQSSKRRQEEVRQALIQATKSLNEAIEITKSQAQQGNPEALKREALMHRRIGDVALSSALVIEERPENINIKTVLAPYEKATKDYQKAGQYNESGMLLSTMAYLVKELQGSDTKQKPNDQEANTSEKQATDYYQRSQKDFHQAGSSAQEAAVLVKLSEIYTNDKDLVSAFQSLDDARKAFRAARRQTKESDEQIALRDREVALLKTIAKVKDKKELEGYYDVVIAEYGDDLPASASALITIGTVYDNDKDTQTAIKYYTLAQQHSREAGDSVQEGKSLVRLAELYVGQGSDQKVIEFFDKARAAYGQIRDLSDKTLREELVGDMVTMGQIYADKKENGRALKAYSQALSFYQQPDPQTTTNYRIHTMILAAGRILGELKDQEAASSFFKDAFAYFGKVKDPSGEAAAFEVAGNVYKELGRKQEARNFYEKAFLASQKSSNTYEQFDALQSIVKFYQDENDEEGAANYLRGVIGSYQKAKDPIGEAKTLQIAGNFYSDLGKKYYDLGKKQEAREHYEKARLAYQKSSAGNEQFNALQKIVKLYQDEKDEEGAAKYFRGVIASYQSAKDLSGEANASQMAGNFYNDIGKKQEAREYFENARLAFQKINNYEQFNTLQKVVKLYQEEKDENGAANYFRGVIASYQSAKDLSGEANASQMAGNFYDGLGKKQEAVDYYKRALPLYQKIGDDKQFELLRRIGKFYLDKADDKGAADFFQETLNGYQAPKNDHAQATALVNIGSLFLEVGKKQDAIKYYERAVVMYEKNFNDRFVESQTLKNLSSIYASLGDTQKAGELTRRAEEVLKRTGP